MAIKLKNVTRYRSIFILHKIKNHILHQLFNIEDQLNGTELDLSNVK